MINNRITHRHLQRAGLLAAFGASAAAILSGCGGASTNTGRATTVATPTVYGINVATASAGSGIEFPVTTPATATTGAVTTTTGGIVGALSTTATALEGALPLGFPAGAAESDLSVGVAVAASQPGVVFRALIANGNVANTSGAITGATLTSPEVTGFTQTLTFTGVGSGPVGSAGYTSPAFTLPFTTSGIHQLNATVTDEGGQSSTTTLGVVVVAPTDVALVLSSFDTGKMSVATATVPAAEIFNPITSGDIVTIDGGTGTGVYPTSYNATTASTADANGPNGAGAVFLFTTPGTHTITETTPGNKMIQTATVTLGPTTAGTTLYNVPIDGSTTPAPATTAAVAKPHLVRRLVKH